VLFLVAMFSRIAYQNKSPTNSGWSGRHLKWHFGLGFVRPPQTKDSGGQESGGPNLNAANYNSIWQI
jgi:hypothetical protein